jgi:predicted ribosome quality control (RQC) complex YloA/Tae2 family protein
MRQLTAFDLHHLVKDMDIEGGKFDKIYMSEENELLITIHVPGKGKRILRAAPPNFFYMTEQKEEMPERLKGFAQYLRKHLGGARIRALRQVGFERILELTLSTKEGMFYLIIELFGRGNVMLCSPDYSILSAMEQKRWKDRNIMQGERYTYPAGRNNPLEVSEEDFMRIFKESELPSAVKVFAVEFGLGGIYAEEACLRAGIDKSRKDDPHAAFKGLVKMREEKPSPSVIKEKASIIDFAPIELEQYKDKERERRESFNDVLNEISTATISSREYQKKNKGRNKEIERLNKIIQSQEELIAQMTKDADEFQRKGELIYENYQMLSDIQQELRKAREKYSLREMKQKLKGHKIIKGLNEEKKEITVSLDTLPNDNSG